jgi:hypothetical protein
LDLLLREVTGRGFGTSICGEAVRKALKNALEP